jgi:hypothetical protein
MNILSRLTRLEQRAGKQNPPDGPDVIELVGVYGDGSETDPVVIYRKITEPSSEPISSPIPSDDPNQAVKQYLNYIK